MKLKLIFLNCIKNMYSLKINYLNKPYQRSYQWLNGSVFKTSKQKVPGSIPGRACRISRSELSVVFSETRVNTG